MNKSLEQREYVHKVIYDSEGKYRPPNAYDDLVLQMSNLAYILTVNPDWTDNIKTDIMNYISSAQDLYMKLSREGLLE